MGKGTTVTAPREAPPAPPDSDTIGWLRDRDSGQQWELDPKQETFVLGTSKEADITIEHPYVSHPHCTLRRVGKRLRVTDADSKNGTVFRGKRELEFSLTPGDQFTVGTAVTLLAISQEMDAVRPSLEYLVGPTDPRTIDDLLILATLDDHILLLGEPRCGQEAIARIVHRVSQRRGQPFVVLSNVPADVGAQIALVKAQSRTMVLVDASILPKKPGEFLDALLFPDYNVRSIVCARDKAQARKLFKSATFPRMRIATLRPLRERRAELSTLVDRLFEDMGYELRAHDLSDENLRALESFDWQGLDDLELTVQRIAAVLTRGSERKAAVELGITHTTISRFFDQRGLIFPKTDEPEPDEDEED